MAEESNLTPEEQKELQEYLTGYATSVQEDKYNIHKFLHNVVVSTDTTKVGYLEDNEVGLPRLPLRTLKELSLFCKDIGNMEYFSDYFNKKAEILTSTSLSRNAKLLELAVVSRRELADVTPKSKKKKKKGGFFNKKEDTEE